MKLFYFKIIAWSLLICAVPMFFIDFSWITENFIMNMSPDNSVKESTLLNFNMLYLGTRVVFLISGIFALLFAYYFERIDSFLSAVFTWFSKMSFNLPSSKSAIKVLLIIPFVLFILSAFFMDVGLDEAFYLNDIQNILKYRFPTRDDGNIIFKYLMQNFGFNIIAIPMVKLFGFSIIMIRAIIIAYSIGIFVLISKLFQHKEFKISSLLLLYFPGSIYIFSAVYLEAIAVFYILLALLMIKKYQENEKKGYILLSSLFLSIAILTKFQVFLFSIIIFLVLFILEQKNRKFILEWASFTFIIYILLFFSNALFVSIKDTSMMIAAIFLGGNTNSAVSFNLETLLNKTIWLNELVFIPILAFVAVKLYGHIMNGKTIYLKYIYAGAIILPIYWVVFHGVSTWRNVFVGIVFAILLISMYFANKIKIRNIAILTYLIIGFGTNILFIGSGNVDNVQYFRSHLLGKVIMRGPVQKDFFEEVNKIIGSNKAIGIIGHQPYLCRLYMNNRSILTSQNVIDDKADYYIITRGELLEGFVSKADLNFLMKNKKCLIEKENYFLFSNK